MTAKKAKTSTISTKKYQQKAGYISKSYKLKKDVIESFKAACYKAGVSQASQITKLMKEFIDETNINEVQKNDE